MVIKHPVMTISVQRATQNGHKSSV